MLIADPVPAREDQDWDGDMVLSKGRERERREIKDYHDEFAHRIGKIHRS